jgi:hypothetical protein
MEDDPAQGGRLEPPEVLDTKVTAAALSAPETTEEVDYAQDQQPAVAVDYSSGGEGVDYGLEDESRGGDVEYDAEGSGTFAQPQAGHRAGNHLVSPKNYLFLST